MNYSLAPSALALITPKCSRKHQTLFILRKIETFLCTCIFNMFCYSLYPKSQRMLERLMPADVRHMAAAPVEQQGDQPYGRQGQDRHPSRIHGCRHIKQFLVDNSKVEINNNHGSFLFVQVLVSFSVSVITCPVECCCNECFSTLYHDPFQFPSPRDPRLQRAPDPVSLGWCGSCLRLCI